MEDESSIIRDIYAAALDDELWQVALDKTAKLLKASSAALFTTYVPTADDGLAVFNGLSARDVEPYLAEVDLVDVWYTELLRRHGRLRTGFQWQSDSLVSVRDLHRSRFFADYLVPCDISRTLGTILGDGSSEGAPLTPLCLYRPVRSKAFEAQDEATLSALQPHFTQALAIRSRLHSAASGSAALAIQRISTAVVILAQDRKIILANPAADELFSTSGLPLVRDGRLCACEPSLCAALDAALKACSTYRFDARFSLSVRLGGPSGNGVVTRLAPPPASSPTKASAIAFIMREGHSPLDIESIVRELYKLTPAETALLRALADGLTPEDFAERRGVKRETVKTQLQSVFSKTGTRKQSTLMRLVYSIAR